MEKLKIEYIPVEKLKPYGNNPRKNDAAVDKVAASIKEFGFHVPIVIDKNKEIVCGHTRLKAAKKLKLKEIPCVTADDLTDEQIKAYRLADNKVSEFADWDDELLDLELDDIDLDMEQFGFDLNTEPEVTEIVEDEVPEEAEARCKRATLWKLGAHRLMCGDATSKEDVERLMSAGEHPTVAVDLLLTDPPYGINVVKNKSVGGDKAFGSKGTADASNIVKANRYSEIIGDDTTETAKQNYEIVRDFTENQVIFGGNYFTDFLRPSRCWLVWDKENTGNFADAELAWTSFDKGVKLYKFMWNGLVGQGSREVEGKTRVHPTQKPVGMLAQILDDFTKENDTVLDCFGGSGSTLIACEQLNRKCYMMEIDPHYCDVIIARWEQFTGGKAELIEV